jgi:putative inorganic carbon (hco3(-)) transporter
MRDLVIAMIVFGSVPFTFVRPYIGLLVFFWLSLMNPHRMTWGFAYTLRVAMIAGAATVVAWLVSRDPKHPPLSTPVVLLFLFTVWITVCTLFAIHQEEAWTKWSQVIKILGMTFVAMCLLQERQRLQLMVWVIAVSLGFYGARGGVFTILTGGNYRVWGPPDTFIADNNQLALAMIMTLPLLWYLYLTTVQRWLRLGVLGVGGLTMIAILGTHSRGGLVALLVMLSSLWLKSRYKVITGVGAVVALLALFAFLPDHWHNRMDSIQNYEQDTSVRQRFEVWRYAYLVALQRPIVGGGFGIFNDKERFMQLLPDSMGARSAHSIYFEVLGETGFVGLGLFLLLGVGTALTAGSVIRMTRGRPDLDWARNLAAMLQVSVIGYAAAGAFLNLGFFDLYYAIIALVVVLKALVVKELRQAEEEARPRPPPRSRSTLRPPVPATARPT